MGGYVTRARVARADVRLDKLGEPRLVEVHGHERVGAGDTE